MTELTLTDAELEARLADLLQQMFDASGLRLFLRRHVSPDLVDDLPAPGGVAKSLYVASAAELLVGRGLVTEAFLAAWSAKVPQRSSEIWSLRRHPDTSGDRPDANG